MANIGSIFKAALPYVTAGLSLIPGGGPAVQILSGVVSKVSGKEVKPEEIAATLSNLATTEQGRIQLQQMENDYAKAMQELKFDTAEKLLDLDATDRASARDREKTVKDKTPLVLAVWACGLLVACLVLIAFVSMPDKAEGAILTLIGFVGAAFKDVYAYYFGSSAGSEAKTQLLAQGGK